MSNKKKNYKIRSKLKDIFNHEEEILSREAIKKKLRKINKDWNAIDFLDIFLFFRKDFREHEWKWECKEVNFFLKDIEGTITALKWNVIGNEYIVDMPITEKFREGLNDLISAILYFYKYHINTLNSHNRTEYKLNKSKNDITLERIFMDLQLKVGKRTGICFKCGKETVSNIYSGTWADPYCEECKEEGKK